MMSMPGTKMKMIAGALCALSAGGALAGLAAANADAANEPLESTVRAAMSPVDTRAVSVKDQDATPEDDEKKKEAQRLEALELAKKKLRHENDSQVEEHDDHGDPFEEVPSEEAKDEQDDPDHPIENDLTARAEDNEPSEAPMESVDGPAGSNIPTPVALIPAPDQPAASQSGQPSALVGNPDGQPAVPSDDPNAQGTPALQQPAPSEAVQPTPMEQMPVMDDVSSPAVPTDIPMDVINPDSNPVPGQVTDQIPAQDIADPDQAIPEPEIPAVQPVQDVPAPDPAPAPNPAPAPAQDVPAPDPAAEVPLADLPADQQPADQQPAAQDYTDLNNRICEAAKALVGTTDGLQCTEVVQLALANAGVADAACLWPREYQGMFGYYTDNPQPGNLIYYNKGGDGLDHVAIYIGNGLAVHGNYMINGKSITTIASVEIPDCTSYGFVQVVR